MSDVIVNGRVFDVDGSVSITNRNYIEAETVYFADGKNLIEKFAEMAELKRKEGSDIRAKLKLTF